MSTSLQIGTLAQRSLAPAAPTQPNIILIAAIIAIVVILVLLVAYLLLGWQRRRATPTGPQAPMEAPELYDLRTEEVTEDIRFCREVAREVGGPVLELGAGTGRIALELARMGLMVTGLETSRLMLQRAKDKAEKLSSKLRVEWVEGDMTNFSLGGRKFKLILAPFNVLQDLGDITDLERCLRCVAEHLEPDGKFVAIVQTPRWQALTIEHRYLKTVHNKRTGELINFYQTLEVDPIWQKLRGSYEYEIWDQNGRMRQVIAPFQGSYLTCPEMALLLRAARMQIDHIYGSFAREELTLKSRQMIFIARLLPEAIQPPPPQQPAPASADASLSGAVTPVLAAAGSTSAGSAVIPLPPPDDPADNNGPPTLITPLLPPSGASGAAAQGVQAPPAAPPARRITGSRRSGKHGK
jgi:ubiquinone/menaquinone biosynthesis C-methylase UbiE